MVIAKFLPSLHCLRCFYYAAIYKNFTQAAEIACYSGQPAISSQIKLLERRFGILFERKARGVELTSKGQALFDLVVPLIERLEHLEQDYRERCAQMRALQVTVAVSASLGLDFLGPVLQRFRRVRPLVDLIVLACRSPQEAVANGVADFGVAFTSALLPGLCFTEILRDPFVIIAPIGHPIAESQGDLVPQISRYPFVRRSLETPTSRIVDSRLQQRGIMLRDVIEIDRWTDIKQAVALGMGLALVPSICVSARDTDLVVIPTGDEFPTRSYGILVKSEGRVSPEAQDLMAWMITACRAAAEQLLTRRNPPSLPPQRSAQIRSQPPSDPSGLHG